MNDLEAKQILKFVRFLSIFLGLFIFTIYNPNSFFTLLIFALMMGYVLAMVIWAIIHQVTKDIE